jgi:hypothetical protein
VIKILFLNFCKSTVGVTAMPHIHFFKFKVDEERENFLKIFRELLFQKEKN